MRAHRTAHGTPRRLALAAPESRWNRAQCEDPTPAALESKASSPPPSGEGYGELRQHAGYAAGQSCPEEIIGLLSLPEQNARVEATLVLGGARAQEALYPLADSHSSQDSSGDEWFPVKRVARRPRRA